MAIETNTFSVNMAVELLQNYLVGKRLLDIITEELSLGTNAEIISLGKVFDQSEIWMTVEGVGTLYFARAQISVSDSL